MPYLTIRGLDLYYEERGTARETIVFSHGLLLNLRMYDEQMKDLEQNYRCIAYDHPGQGLSDAPDGPMIDMESCYDVAATLIETIGGGPVHFVGLSMGGFVGLRLASRRPDLIKTLTLIDTSADAEPSKNIAGYRRMIAVSRMFSPAMLARKVMPILFGDEFLNDPARESQRSFWEHMLRQNRRSIYKAVNGVIYRPSITAETRLLKIPTLVIHGTDDRAISRRRAENLAELTKGEFVLIQGSGHSPTIEAPEAVCRALRTFVDAHSEL
jgi:3-oxoadipate enol-lactonase